MRDTDRVADLIAPVRSRLLTFVETESFASSTSAVARTVLPLNGHANTQASRVPFSCVLCTSGSMWANGVEVVESPAVGVFMFIVLTPNERIRRREPGTRLRKMLSLAEQPRAATIPRSPRGPPAPDNSPSRSVAQPGSAPAWGAGGRRFKSSRSDHFFVSYTHVPSGTYVLHLT